MLKKYILTLSILPSLSAPLYGSYSNMWNEAVAENETDTVEGLRIALRSEPIDIDTAWNCLRRIYTINACANALEAAIGLNAPDPIVAYLLARGVNVNMCFPQRYTLLHIAISANNILATQTLLAHGADPCAIMPDGRAPLHLAAQCHTAPITQALLQYGAQVNMQNSEGFTALHFAAFYGDLDSVVALIEYGADARIKNNDGVLPFDFALQGGHPAIAVMLK